VVLGSSSSGFTVVEKRYAVLIPESQKLKEKRFFEKTYFGGLDLGA
jgi:hypothetical protein